MDQMGEIAPLVRQSSDGEEMRGLLDHIDSLRADLGDSNDALQDVARAEETERKALHPHGAAHLAEAREMRGFRIPTLRPAQCLIRVCSGPMPPSKLSA